MSDRGTRTEQSKRNRYGVTAAFWVDAEDDDEARLLVGNSELEEEDVEVDDE